jgi:hypothetical protein
MAVKPFPFRYRDSLTGRWVNARYKATPDEIAARYAEWEITGPPEILNVETSAAHFPPVAACAVDSAAALSGGRRELRGDFLSRPSPINLRRFRCPR